MEWGTASVCCHIFVFFLGLISFDPHLSAPDSSGHIQKNWNGFSKITIIIVENMVSASTYLGRGILGFALNVWAAAEYIWCLPWEGFAVPTVVLSMLNCASHCRHSCRCRWSVVVARRWLLNLSGTKKRAATPIPLPIWCWLSESTAWLRAKISLQRNETSFYFMTIFNLLVFIEYF